MMQNGTKKHSIGSDCGRFGSSSSDSSQESSPTPSNRVRPRNVSPNTLGGAAVTAPSTPISRKKKLSLRVIPRTPPSSSAAPHTPVAAAGIPAGYRPQGNSQPSSSSAAPRAHTPPAGSTAGYRPQGNGQPRSHAHAQPHTHAHALQRVPRAGSSGFLDRSALNGFDGLSQTSTASGSTSSPRKKQAARTAPNTPRAPYHGHGHGQVPLRRPPVTSSSHSQRRSQVLPTAETRSRANHNHSPPPQQQQQQFVTRSTHGTHHRSEPPPLQHSMPPLLASQAVPPFSLPASFSPTRGSAADDATGSGLPQPFVDSPKSAMCADANVASRKLNRRHNGGERFGSNAQSPRASALRVKPRTNSARNASAASTPTNANGSSSSRTSPPLVFTPISRKSGESPSHPMPRQKPRREVPVPQNGGGFGDRPSSNLQRQQQQQQLQRRSNPSSSVFPRAKKLGRSASTTDAHSTLNQIEFDELFRFWDRGSSPSVWQDNKKLRASVDSCIQTTPIPSLSPSLSASASASASPAQVLRTDLRPRLKSGAKARSQAASPRKLLSTAAAAPGCAGCLSCTAPTSASRGKWPSERRTSCPSLAMSVQEIAASGRVNPAPFDWLTLEKSRRGSLPKIEQTQNPAQAGAVTPTPIPVRLRPPLARTSTAPSISGAQFRDFSPHSRRPLPSLPPPPDFPATVDDLVFSDDEVDVAFERGNYPPPPPADTPPPTIPPKLSKTFSQPLLDTSGGGDSSPTSGGMVPSRHPKRTPFFKSHKKKPSRAPPAQPDGTSNIFSKNFRNPQGSLRRKSRGNNRLKTFLDKVEEEMAADPLKNPSVYRGLTTVLPDHVDPAVFTLHARNGHSSSPTSASSVSQTSSFSSASATSSVGAGRSSSPFSSLSTASPGPTPPLSPVASHRSLRSHSPPTLTPTPSSSAIFPLTPTPFTGLTQATAASHHHHNGIGVSDTTTTNVFEHIPSLLELVCIRQSSSCEELAKAIETLPVHLLCPTFPTVDCIIEMFLTRLNIKALASLKRTIAMRLGDPDVSQVMDLVKENFTGSALDDLKTRVDSHVFFRSLADSNMHKGLRIDLPSDFLVYHPFRVGARRVVHIECRLVFPSNAKPCLLQLHIERSGNKIVGSPQNQKALKMLGAGESDLDRNAMCDPDPCLVILKTGDNLQCDVACLSSFHLMNSIWRRAKLRTHGYYVEAKVYQTVSFGNDIGLLEFVPGCISLNELKPQDLANDSQKLQRLISSAAGAYIACYILGIRDRHSDNILIDEHGSLFHIDFGYLLGKGVALDTYVFAIPTQLKEAMAHKWELFVALSVKAYSVLRSNSKLLLEALTIAFVRIAPAEEIQNFLRTSLMLDLEHKEALREIRKQLSAAPTSLRTKLKNKMHNIAQNLSK